MFGIKKLTKAIRELAEVGRSILKWLRLGQPGLVFLKVVAKDGKMLNFVLTLPVPGASDVVARELFVSVAGGEPQVQTLDGAALESSELSGEQDNTVIGTLVDIDDAGNRSDARDFSFVLVDNLAPPQPGELGIRVTSEV